ncbi:MAG: hypothetical protein U9R47_11715, partial [Actinomycetota bacterium]|nr:hypothetical protein [Actinomycetota bacterium]
MKRTISSVLALAMVAALLAVFAGAASAQVTEDSGQIAVVNGTSTDPVTATAGGGAIGGDLVYAADSQAAVFAAGQYDVVFSDGSTTAVDLAAISAVTVVSGYGDDTDTAKSYGVDMTPIDAGMAKVTVWNATGAPVQVAIDGAAATELAPGESLPTATVAADTPVGIDIDGVKKDIATPA